MLPVLPDSEIQANYGWADSAYSGQCFAVLLSLGGFESRINEKVSLKHLLSEAIKERNFFKSAIRAGVEHILAV